MSRWKIFCQREDAGCVDLVDSLCVGCDEMAMLLQSDRDARYCVFQVKVIRSLCELALTCAALVKKTWSSSGFANTAWH